MSASPAVKSPAVPAKQPRLEFAKVAPAAYAAMLALSNYTKDCGLEPGDVMWVSAASGTGIEELQSHVRTLLGT